MQINIEYLKIGYEKFSLSIEHIKIPEGITLLIGPNGAGKTTFLESLLGLRVPDVHKVKVGNYKLNIPLSNSFKESLGFMPSIPMLFKIKSLNYHKKLWKLLYPDFDENTYQQLLEKFSLTRYRKTKELSAGQRRMFMFCLQLSYNPDIFILDEPFAFLDIKQSKVMLEELMNYSKKFPEKVILISSHLINWLQQFKFNTLIINKGKIIKQGIIEEDYETFF